MKKKISAIKLLEFCNGVKYCKSFDFELDPIEMARYKTVATVKRKIEDYVAKNGIFRNDELNDLKYEMKDFLNEWKVEVKRMKEKEREEDERYNMEMEEKSRRAVYITLAQELKALQIS